MFKKMMNVITLCIVVGWIATISSTAQADWLETFGGNALDQAWTWGCYPDVTGTFSYPIKDGPGDDDYLGLDETTKYDPGIGSYGSAFGMGFGPEDFADVRVGAVVNVMGDASRNYFGIAARANSFIDPDGSITGAPGTVVTGAYILMYHWEDGPLRMRIELLKVYMNDDGIMEVYEPEVPVPGLDGTHYVELDVLGSDPVYVTGSIYEYKGGPLLARTPTMVDTSGNDPWERSGLNDAVYASGKSGVFTLNEDANPVGYHVTFDTVSSTSDGPSVVCLSPADGATGVDIDADLAWVEGTSTTSRELWFGKEGAMRPYSAAGATFEPGTLEFGQTYQWRVDQIGLTGPVEGYVYTFTTEGTPEGCLLIDDFESYSGTSDIFAAWPDNIPVWDYTFLETVTVLAGDKAMRFEWQNQYDPYFTMLTHTFAEPQDWTIGGLAVLSLNFQGEENNYEQKLFVGLEDEVGTSFEVPNPYNSFAVLTESWEKWNIELSQFSDNSVDLSRVKKVSIRVGDGTDSGQPIGPPVDTDFLYIDEIKVCPLRCSLNSNADVDGSCRIDFGDFSAIANEWLNEGEYVLP